MVAGCEAGQRDDWGAFLREYGPIAYAAFDLYLGPSYEGGRDKFWKRALSLLTENGFERLRQLEHQSEREFLVGLRALLLESANAGLNAQPETSAPPEPTVESVKRLLQGLPLVDQQVVFLKLAGYSDASLERMLRITPTVAQKGLERLRADYGAALGRERDSGLWPTAWLAVLRQAWNERTENCTALRLMIRILDGQIGWHEKTPAEQHLSGCLHCLERFTALQEIVYWKRETKPLAAAEIQPLLEALPLAAPSKAAASFLKRAFGRKASSG
jgi:hypothetical protein